MSVMHARHALRPVPSQGVSRAFFLARLNEILGDDRLVWTPKSTDTTTARTDDPGNRIITWDATVAARLSALGSGTQQTFVSASSQFGTTPDTANLSFNTAGLLDLPFSIVALANVTDTAAARALVTKFNGAGSTREWILTVTAADLLAFQLADNSVPVIPDRTSNAAITMGSWRLFGATYDGTGGVTAANGMVLYQDGAAIASTATNQATYVAMEDLGAPVEIGSAAGGTGSLFDGSIALVAVCAGVLSAAAMQEIRVLCNQFFRLAL